MSVCRCSSASRSPQALLAGARAIRRRRGIVALSPVHRSATVAPSKRHRRAIASPSPPRARAPLRSPLRRARQIRAATFSRLAGFILMANEAARWDTRGLETGCSCSLLHPQYGGSPPEPPFFPPAFSSKNSAALFFRTTRSPE